MAQRISQYVALESTGLGDDRLQILSDQRILGHHRTAPSGENGPANQRVQSPRLHLYAAGQGHQQRPAHGGCRAGADPSTTSENQRQPGGIAGGRVLLVSGLWAGAPTEGRCDGPAGGENSPFFCLTPMSRAPAVAERLRALVETQPLCSDHHAISCHG